MRRDKSVHLVMVPEDSYRMDPQTEGLPGEAKTPPMKEF